MKKILIATRNKDKYSIVKNLLKKAGLTEKGYQILSLDDINYKGTDKKEIGTIVNRAVAKAKDVIETLESESYDYVIGIDDGICLKGKLIENVKEYLNKILYENYLSENEKIEFPRAYCLMNWKGEIFNTVIEIPYIYKSKENANIKALSYPLSQIAVPIGFNKPIAEMSEKESLEYYWKYSEKKIKELIENIK